MTMTVGTGTARWHDGERFLFVIYRTGRTKLHLTFRDESGIRHMARPLEEARYLIPVLHRGKPYPVDRALRKLRALDCSKTEAAKQELAAVQKEVWGFKPC